MEDTLFEIAAPTDKRSIVDALETLDNEIGDYFEALSMEEFFAPQGTAWSPCGHLVHLIKSVSPLARAMALPRLLLALRFGRSRAGSGDFEAVRRRYREALDGGLKAGPYGPSNRPEQLPAAARRGRTLGRWRRAGGELRGVIHRWSEEDLDRYRLPHPGIGKLTVREMLFFTVYHNAHHARRVLERRLKADP